MKVLIINVNASEEYTKTIDGTAKKYASPGTEITTVNPEEGEEWLGTAESRDAQIAQVAEIVKENANSYDAIVYACGLDVGLETLRQIAKNVIGIGEAAIFTACAVAKKFSILLVTKQPETWAGERMRAFGIDPSRCVSARCVGDGSGETVAKRHELRDVWYEVAKKCINEDGAEAIVISCAMASDLKEYLEQRLQVPVIASTIAAVKIAEQMPSKWFSNLGREKAYR